MKHKLSIVKFGQAIPVGKARRMTFNINLSKIEHKDYEMILDGDLIHVKGDGRYFIVPAQGNVEYMEVEQALEGHLKRVKKAANG